MGSIPLITHWSDPRNLLTVATVAGYLIMAARCAHPCTPRKQALTLSMVNWRYSFCMVMVNEKNITSDGLFCEEAQFLLSYEKPNSLLMLFFKPACSISKGLNAFNSQCPLFARQLWIRLHQRAWLVYSKLFDNEKSLLRLPIVESSPAIAVQVFSSYQLSQFVDEHKL